MAEKNGSRPKPDLERLRADIKLTRAELGETVQALAAKADVKARAKAEVEQTKQRIRAQIAEATGPVREAAHAATDRVRHMAGTSHGETEGPILAAESGVDAGGRMRRAPIPLTAMLIAAAAVVGVILVVRGRRR